MTDLMWGLKDRVKSRMNPRLRTSEKGQMAQSSTERKMFPTFRSSTLNTTIMSSFCLLLFSRRRYDDSHVLILRRRLTRDWGGSWVEGFSIALETEIMPAHDLTKLEHALSGILLRKGRLEICQ